MVSKSQVNSIDNANVACELCGGSHSYTQCNVNSNANEDVSFVQGSFNQRGGLNSNTYNPQWRNHPGFLWSNPSSQLNPPFNQNFSKPKNPPGFPIKPNHPSFSPQPPTKTNLEGLMEEFINQQSTTNKQHEDHFKQLNARIDQLVSHNRILENQIVQQASSTPQPLGRLPS